MLGWWRGRIRHTTTMNHLKPQQITKNYIFGRWWGSSKRRGPLCLYVRQQHCKILWQKRSCLTTFEMICSMPSQKGKKSTWYLRMRSSFRKLCEPVVAFIVHIWKQCKLSETSHRRQSERQLRRWIKQSETLKLLGNVASQNLMKIY